jgi:hypothetical protein
MLEFLRAGGMAMGVILLFGGLTILASVLYLVRPGERRYEFFRALSMATLWASLAGLCAGTAMTLHGFMLRPEWAQDPQRPIILMQGLAESLCNPILGFCILAVAWFLVAFGAHRDGLPRA